MNSVDCWLENEETHLKELVYDNVPLLTNVGDFCDGAMVRFRGMVQDMFGPEYYMDSFEIIKNTTRTVSRGKYRDNLTITDGSLIGNEIHKERHCFVVITPPGTNKWVLSNNSLKRKFEDMEGLSKEHYQNHPLANESTLVAHVKVYQNFDNIKINELYEFVGFLSVHPLAMDDAMDDLEDQTHNPPASLVPRLHAIDFRSLSDINPLNGAVNNFKEVKNQLLVILSQLLLGDNLCAEYLMCHLISQVYLRRDFMPIGKLSLNISNLPQINEYCKEIYNFIELITTKSHYLPLTLENLNTIQFTPKKDYECNRLSGGLLQLSKNTHLVVDETKMLEGKLEVNGLKELRALNDVIRNQTLAYDFGFYPIEYDCDIPVLVMSHGKSMLSSDIHIKLQGESDSEKMFGEIVEAAKHYLQPYLDDIRRYLTQVKLVEFQLQDDAIQTLVQEEFVKMRSNGQVTGDDLHTLLVLARLQCVSEGKNRLDGESWKKACEMEQQRKLRL